jgi:hypothetical protein
MANQTLTEQERETVKDAELINYLRSVAGGCTSGIKCYDKFISGERQIGKAARGIALLEGRDAMESLIEKRNALVAKRAEALETISQILADDPTLMQRANAIPNWA